MNIFFQEAIELLLWYLILSKVLVALVAHKRLAIKEGEYDEKWEANMALTTWNPLSVEGTCY